MEKYLGLIAISHLSLLGVFLLVNQNARNLGVKLLGAFLTMLSIHFTILFFQDQLVNQFSQSLVDGILYTFLFSYGPLLYLVNDFYLSDNQSINFKRVMLNFITVPVFIIYFLFVHEYIARWPFRNINMLWIVLIGHLIYYINGSFGLFTKYAASKDFKIKRKVLFVLNMGFLALILTWCVVLLDKQFVQSFEPILKTAYLVLLIGMVDGLIVLFFVSPDFFCKSKHLRSRINQWTNDKYESSEVSEKYAGRLLKDIQKIVIEDQNFKDSELTLSKLSKLSGYPSRDISQVVNMMLSKNFKEYLCEIRVGEAQRLLMHKEEHKTVYEVMVAVGFNSRSIFHKHFKETFGCTPKEYQQRCSQYRSIQSDTIRVDQLEVA